MRNKNLNVFVTGATGHQGGAVARHLLSRGHSVQALTRNPDSQAARDLHDDGARLVVGSFEDIDVCRQAMARADAVFAMTTWREKGVEQEIRHGKMLIDAASEAEVEHFVLASVASANRSTHIPHFESKFEVELYLRHADLPRTVVAPVFFMENFCNLWFMPGIREGRLAMALPSRRKLQMVAVDDIGAMVAEVIEERPSYLGKRIEIASDELSGHRVAKILSRVLKHKISYQQTDIADLELDRPDYARLFEWLDRVGYTVDIRGLKKQHKTIGWHKFEDWAREYDWTNLLAVAPAA